MISLEITKISKKKLWENQKNLFLLGKNHLLFVIIFFKENFQLRVIGTIETSKI